MPYLSYFLYSSTLFAGLPRSCGFFSFVVTVCRRFIEARNNTDVHVLSPLRTYYSALISSAGYLPVLQADSSGQQGVDSVGGDVRHGVGEHAHGEGLGAV